MIESIHDIVLPIAIKGASSEGDLERAALALDSLQAMWFGSEPLRVHLVARDAELPAVRGLVKGVRPQLKVDTISEMALVDDSTCFAELPGWWKQQYLKLAFARLGIAESYLTFDADVVAIRPFNEMSFVDAGRVVSQWESQGTQRWWRNLSETLGFNYAPEDYGLSVTPNTLISEIAKRSLDFLRFSDSVTSLQTLVDLYRRGMPGSTWTEYSLYTKVGEAEGTLFSYHIEPEKLFAQQRVLHCDFNVWAHSDAEQLENVNKAELKGWFMVVQSTSNVHIATVRQFLSL